MTAPVIISDAYRSAFGAAWRMMKAYEGLEPCSALKQAACDAGIAEGEDLARFVTWAEGIMFGGR
jgi:hypothetical protein